MALSDDDPRPPYQQIADDLREQIQSGLLAPGHRLPSTRDLMERYEVANQTVQSAMRTLRAESLVHSVAGRGIYVTDETGKHGGGADSPQYNEIMSRLDDLASQMRRIDERLNELEGSATSAVERGAKPKTRPSRSKRQAGR